MITNFDKIHYDGLMYGILLFYKLLNTNYNKLKGHIFFTGGTSLMFKYGNNFNRFSKDLYFSINHMSKKQFDKDFDNLIFDLKNGIESYLRNKGILVYTNSDWRTITFNGDFETKTIKLDYMYDYILQTEHLILNNSKIIKVSDFDIFLNKLCRLNKTDISDINLLLKHNSSQYNIENIKQGFFTKGLKYRGNKNYYFMNNKILWNKNIKSLSFLKHLL